MNSEAMKNLPPEMQQRLNEIMQQQQAAAGVTLTPQRPLAPIPAEPAPIVKPPSLMDHLIALRQEVAAMRQEMANLGATVEANSSVVEAVGQATGQIYQMFQQTPTQGGTYSSQFQQEKVDDGQDY